MTWVTCNLVSVRLETVLMSVEDRCMVCARRTIGSHVALAQKSFWTHPMELLADVGHVESYFIPF